MRVPLTSIRMSGLTRFVVRVMGMAMPGGLGCLMKVGLVTHLCEFLPFKFSYVPGIAECSADQPDGCTSSSTGA